MPDPSQQQSPGASPPASGLHSPQQPNNMLPRGPGRNVVPSGHQSQSGSGRPSGPPPQSTCLIWVLESNAPLASSFLVQDKDLLVQLLLLLGAHRLKEPNQVVQEPQSQHG